MAVEQAGPRQEEGGIRHRADMGAAAQAPADPAHRVVGDKMIGVAARADDDAVDLRRIAGKKAGLDDDAVRGLDRAFGGADDDPAVAFPLGQDVGRTQRLDDRTERHHRKAGEDQHREGERGVVCRRLVSLSSGHDFNRPVGNCREGHNSAGCHSGQRAVVGQFENSTAPRRCRLSG